MLSGVSVASAVGSVVGSTVGSTVGSVVGSTVGSAVGSTVGSAVGSVVGSTLEKLESFDELHEPVTDSEEVVDSSELCAMATSDCPTPCKAIAKSAATARTTTRFCG